MRVERLSDLSSTVFPRLISVPRAGDRLAAPVRPIDSVYANFRHVRGVPSPDGGVSVFQLRMLDRLIDRLLSDGGPAGDGSPSASRGAPPAERGSAFDVSGLPAAAVEREIAGLGRSLRGRMLGRASPFGGFFPEVGTLVDLVA